MYRAALAAALALSPADNRAAAAVVGLEAAGTGSGAALSLAKRLALAAPTNRWLWSLAADAALAAGRPDSAPAEQALACAVASYGAHAALARMHEANGNPIGQAFRMATARRLLRKAPGWLSEEVSRVQAA